VTDEEKQQRQNEILEKFNRRDVVKWAAKAVEVEYKVPKPKRVRPIKCEKCGNAFILVDTRKKRYSCICPTCKLTRARRPKPKKQVAPKAHPVR